MIVKVCNIAHHTFLCVSITILGNVDISVSKIPASRNLHSREERQITIKDIRNRYTVRALEDKAGKGARSMFGGFCQLTWEVDKDSLS